MRLNGENLEPYTLVKYLTTKNLFTEKSFDQYLSSFPKYRKKHPNRYENFIRDYLTRNRSARLMEIVKGCQERGIKFKPHDPRSLFYKSLKNLIESGHITKKDKIYIWNYNE